MTCSVSNPATLVIWMEIRRSFEVLSGVLREVCSEIAPPRAGEAIKKRARSHSRTSASRRQSPSWRSSRRSTRRVPEKPKRGRGPLPRTTYSPSWVFHREEYLAQKVASQDNARSVQPYHLQIEAAHIFNEQLDSIDRTVLNWSSPIRTPHRCFILKYHR